jgi:general secretion pathway protein A
MFEEFYKLAEQPFGVTPDPRYLYCSPTHSEALASLMYGVQENRGFTALIAHPGMGKTTLLFDFLERIHLSARTVFLFQTQSCPRELMRSLLADLGIPEGGEDVVGMQLKLNDILMREAGSGKKVVIVLDEAQALNEEVLEALRMLSNFESSREKLIHVLLAGQPQLAERLTAPSMVQFRQRISIVARLTPFNAAETRAYIEHRLTVAGHQGWRPIFTDHAYALIAKHSQGIPRNVNNLCFNAMSIGCALRQRSIGPGVIYEVLRDLDLRPLSAELVDQPSSVGLSVLPPSQSHGTWRKWLAVLSILMSLAIIICLSIPPTRGYSNGNTSERLGVLSQSPSVAVPNQGFSVNPSGEKQETRSSGVKNLPSTESLYRICLRNLNASLAHTFHELQHWVERCGLKTTLQLRPDFSRNSS